MEATLSYHNAGKTEIDIAADGFDVSGVHNVHVLIQRESGGGIVLTTTDAGIEEDDTTASLALIP